MMQELILPIVVLFIIINLISLYLFYADKRKAVKGNYRTRETTLLIAGFIGPFGAVAGMRVFRHKTRVAKFKLVYLFSVLHVVGIVLLLIMF
jgi:uncharacterized membrane protein YsdA (DUF1294 family)